MKRFFNLGTHIQYIHISASTYTHTIYIYIYTHDRLTTRTAKRSEKYAKTQR